MKVMSVGILVGLVLILSGARAGAGEALADDTRLAGLPSRQVREARVSEDKKIKKKKKSQQKRIGLKAKERF